MKKRLETSDEGRGARQLKQGVRAPGFPPARIKPQSCNPLVTPAA